jgi:hypothetical protein
MSMPVIKMETDSLVNQSVLYKPSLSVLLQSLIPSRNTCSALTVCQTPVNPADKDANREVTSLLLRRLHSGWYVKFC